MASVDPQTDNSCDATFEKPESEKFFATDDYHNQFTSRLVILREYERLTDVTLKCEDVKVACHKVVLAAASSYFHAMFCNGAFEESKQDVVEMKTFSPTILSTIISFIYTGEALLTTENVQNICSACDELELSELKEGCDFFMAHRVEPVNCFGLYMFAKILDLQSTLEECQKCMQRNLKELLNEAPDSELKAFGEEELIEYISSDDLEVEDESAVFKLVERWILADRDSRMESVDRVMEHVRLPYCSPTLLSTEIRQSPIMQSMRCANLVIDALAFKFVPGTTQLISSDMFKPRQCEYKLLLLDGDNKAKGKCWYMDTQKKQWNEFTNLPKSNGKLIYFKACINGNDIILTGGYTNTPTDASWAFCLQKKKWRALPSMNLDRDSHAMVSVDDEVYVMGGYRDTYGTDEVEKLDAQRQNWMQMTPMRRKLFNHVAVNIDQRIYVMGGRTKASASSRMTQVYDLSNDQWEIKANMPHACDDGSAVVFDERLYVVGGENQCCLSYDYHQDIWATLTRPIQTRVDSAAVVWRGKIVLCGGSDRNSVEEYDVKMDQWIPWQMNMPASLSYHTLLVANVSFK